MSSWTKGSGRHRAALVIALAASLLGVLDAKGGADAPEPDEKTVTAILNRGGEISADDRRILEAFRDKLEREEDSALGVDEHLEGIRARIGKALQRPRSPGGEPAEVPLSAPVAAPGSAGEADASRSGPASSADEQSLAGVAAAQSQRESGIAKSAAKGMNAAAGLAGSLGGSPPGDGLGPAGADPRGADGSTSGGTGAGLASADGMAPGPPSDPSRPRTPRDFMLAATPYKGAFAAEGLAVRPGPGGEPRVFRRDGGTASPEDIERLRRRIESEPTSLVRNPDFFDVARGGISREQFADLKRRYQEDAASLSTDFKHISMTPGGRDFQWSRSCDIASGSCNPHAGKSYRGAQDVPPRDLKSIWDKVGASLRDAKERGGQAAASRLARERVGRSGLAGRGLAGRVRAMVGSLSASLRGGEAATGDDVGTGPAGSSPAAEGTAESSGVRGESAQRHAGWAQGARASQATEDGSGLPRQGSPRGWAVLVLAGVVALLLAAPFFLGGAEKRRGSESSAD